MGGPTQRRRLRLRARTLLASAGVLFALAPAASATTAGVAGRVSAETRPLPDATVYAYQVVEKSLRQVLTDPSGEFLFEQLPAGLYKIIALKSGFSPVVTVVTRRGADESQFVQVELPRAETTSDPGGFWELRAEVPADVLRELDVPLGAEIVSLVPSEARPRPTTMTSFSAETSVAELEESSRAQVLAGTVGLRSRVGKVRLAVDGDFRKLETANVGSESGYQGEAAALRVELAGSDEHRVDIATESQNLTRLGDSETLPVDYDRFLVRYHRDLGSEGSTAVVAQYVDQKGLYGRTRVHPIELPLISKTFRLEGTYARDFGSDASLRAGVRYRESIGDYSTRRAGEMVPDIQLRSVDAWSYADWDLDSTWVVQYGLFTTARDGTISLTPRGGVLMRLTPQLQASISASQRFDMSSQDELLGDFVPASLDQTFGCESSESTCYEIGLQGGDLETNHFAVGASWREFDRTVRLFLDDDLFGTGEGLFLVPGDQLPQLHASFGHRIGPNLVARWTSRFAEGGGGAFRAANRRVYENQVELISTAVDATYRPTSTGVYMAFHRVEQQLGSFGRSSRRNAGAELERFELAVSQDLAPFFDVATDWAVRVGMELLRGETLFEPLPVDSSESRHRITTGVAVRF